MSNPETSTWTGVVPGYSDGVLPHAYAFGIPGVGIRTHLGMLPLPGANTAAGYVRMADDGVRVLCQGQNDDRAWLWFGGVWMAVGVAWGPNAVIFGPDGEPVINDTQAKFQATGGLRAVVNGRIVGCTETYADPARGLYEYTEWLDVAIGQGGKDINQGAVVRFADDGILRRFAEGVIRNVRVHRVGDDFAITTLNYDTLTARVTWRSLAELRALPAVVVVPPPIEPPIEPPDPPVDPPDPPVDPPIDPPKPPKPKPFRTHIKERIMADQIVVLRGPGGKLCRPDGPNTGPWAGIGAGWRGLIFDGLDKNDARYHHVQSKPDTDYALVSKQTGGILGCDATEHSGGLDKQFYYKPDGNTDRGWAETFRIYDGNGNGAIEAQIEYAPGSGGDAGAFFSYPLAVEVVG